MAVLYKEGAFSSTEVVKMIACTGSLIELSTFPTVGVGMGINPGTKIRDFYSPFTFFFPYVMVIHSSVLPLQTGALIRLCLPLLTPPKGKRGNLTHAACLHDKADRHSYFNNCLHVLCALGPM